MIVNNVHTEFKETAEDAEKLRKVFEKIGFHVREETDLDKQVVFLYSDNLVTTPCNNPCKRGVYM